MSVLDSILKKKSERLKYAKSSLSIHELKKRLRDMDKTRDFKSAIKSYDKKIKLIAKIKKASPSKGLIRKEFDLIKIVSIYDEKPVSAISVLTEEDF